ncbi:MAG TPA: hypothetical protein VF400_10475, partial [Anaeromyxobacteraceae bacterium]
APGPRLGNSQPTPAAAVDTGPVCRRRAAFSRPEPVSVDEAGAAGAASEPDASARPEALERYVRQRDLERQPKYRLAAASAALWFYRELAAQVAAQVAADLRTEETDRARGIAGSLPSRKAELLEQLRHLDEIVAAARAEIADSGRAPLACEHPLVQKAALCTGYRVLRTLPEGSSAEAVDRLCSSDEQRALVDLVHLDDGAKYSERAPRAMVYLAYDLDHAYVVARSVEVCLGSSRYLPYVEEKLDEAPVIQRARADTLRYALQDASAELTEAGLEQLRCDDPEVQRVIRCVVRAGVIGREGPRCQAPELRALLARVRRG